MIIFDKINLDIIYKPTLFKSKYNTGMEIQQYQNLFANVASIVQAGEKARTAQEHLACYEKMVTLLNHQSLSDQFPFVRQLLSKTNQQRLFRALFVYLTDKIALNNHPALQKEVTAFLVSLIDQNIESNRSKNKCMIDTILIGRCVLLTNLVDSCKQCQLRSQLSLRLINDVLVQAALSQTVSDRNFTPFIGLALKVMQVEGSVEEGLMDECLRHVLVVDHIQKGQVFKIILQNAVIVQSICQHVRRSSVSGYWYYLIARLWLSITRSNGKTPLIVSETFDYGFAKIVGSIEPDADLSGEMAKICRSQRPVDQKIRLIQLIRSYCYYLSVYLGSSVKQGTITSDRIGLIEQCLGFRDFLSFSYLIPLYADLVKNNRVEVTAKIISHIQQNCIPLYEESAEGSVCSNVNELLFLSNSYEDNVIFRISKDCSQAMEEVICYILTQRGCIAKERICVCFEEYIHSAIQSQYDYEFNSHQFMSACHLMRREVDRVLRMNPSSDSNEQLKQYLFNNLKWLLNLNESCQPHQRKYIHFRLFDLLLAFPPLLSKNEFLKEVVDHLLISRLPHTLPYLKRLVAFYKNEQTQSTKNQTDLQSTKPIERLSLKLVAYCGSELMDFAVKLEVWNIVLSIWQNDQNKLNELVNAQNVDEEHTLAKYCVCKNKKLAISERLSPRATQIIEKMSKNTPLYQQTLKAMQLFLKSH